MIVSRVIRAVGSRTFRKYTFGMFVVPLLVLAALITVIVIVAHLRPGASWHGFSALWSNHRIRSAFWFLFVLVYVLPVLCSLVRLHRLRRSARQHGLTWYDYLDRIVKERRTREQEQE